VNIMPVLIPLRHLDGYHVWVGNHLAGACWRDRWGVRWHVTWYPPARFITGYTDDIAEAIKCVTANFSV
jgi:hypothetical protein